MAVFIVSGRPQERKGRGKAEPLSIPFDFAVGRGSLLIRVRINRQAALLIVDTGSSHTILRPSVAGVNASELGLPRTGGVVIGDALGQEVALEVGQQVWPHRLVAVMDLSAVLSAYQERIDGVLGIDFLLEFSQTVIDLKGRRITFTP